MERTDRNHPRSWKGIDVWRHRSETPISQVKYVMCVWQTAHTSNWGTSNTLPNFYKHIILLAHHISSLDWHLCIPNHLCMQLCSTETDGVDILSTYLHIRSSWFIIQYLLCIGRKAISNNQMSSEYFTVSTSKIDTYVFFCKIYECAV